MAFQHKIILWTLPCSCCSDNGDWQKQAGKCAQSSKERLRKANRVQRWGGRRNCVEQESVGEFLYSWCFDHVQEALFQSPLDPCCSYLVEKTNKSIDNNHRTGLCLICFSLYQILLLFINNSIKYFSCPSHLLLLYSCTRINTLYSDLWKMMTPCS